MKAYILFMIVTVLSNFGWARPEYAVKLAVNRCTMCHLSSTGGGFRNITGKTFGAKNFQLGPYSVQDMISVDARAVYYKPENVNPAARSGLAWMAGIVGANIPLTAPEEQNELRLVFTHDVGGFTSDRDFYLRWQRYSDAEARWSPQYIYFGRFLAPFGVIGDEHRTYTHVQTQTTINQLEMGLLTSGNPTDRIHYDLATVNGENSAGSSLAADQASTWGAIANIRVTPQSVPIMFGVSGSHHNRPPQSKSSSAGIVYGVLSLDRITSGFVPGAFIFEYARGEKMNSNIEAGFLDTATTYDETIAGSRSEGMLAQFNYDFGDLTTLVFRYDQLILDVNYPKDVFRRYGIGFRRYLHANTLLHARYEVSEANHPSQKKSGAKSALDAFFMILQIGI